MKKMQDGIQHLGDIPSGKQPMEKALQHININNFDRRKNNLRREGPDSPESASRRA